MNVVWKMLVLVISISFLAGCGTYPNRHGGYSSGISADVDFLGIGVDASTGIHTAGGYMQGGVAGRQVVAGGGMGAGGAPCQRTLGVVMAADGLAQWATVGGQGVERRSMQANGFESGGRGSYNCVANLSGQSSQIGGQVILPPPRQQMPMYQPQQQFAPGYGGGYQQGGQYAPQY